MKRIEPINLEGGKILNWKNPEDLIPPFIIARKLNEIIEAINDLIDNQERGHR